MKGIFLLFRKEILQAVRDRRTVFITVVFPIVFYPLMFGIIGKFIHGEQERLTELIPQVLVVAEEASEFLSAITSTPKLFAVLASDLEAGMTALRAGDGDVLLYIRGMPKRGELGYALTMYFNAASAEAQAASVTVRSFVQEYFQGLVLEKIAAIGIDPETVSPPFSFEVVDIGKEIAFAQVLLFRMLPYFLVLSILSGAMGFGAEITAGEKERGTIATLLSSRLSRTEIVMGKFFAVLSVSLVTTFLSAIGLILGIQTFGAGFSGLSPASSGWILVLLLPLAMALSAVVLIVGAFARTQKEASAYLLPLLMIIVLVGISTMIGKATPGGAELAIPIAGPMAAVQLALAGKLRLADIMWALFSSTALALLLLILAVRIFRSEQVLFRI